MRAARPRARRALDRRALVCLVLGLLVLAGGLLAALSHSAQRRTGTNGVWPQLVAGQLAAGQRACQDGELLPAGSAEAQVVVQPLQAVGPRVAVTLSHGGVALARASALVAAREGTTLHVPLQPRPRDLDGVTICLTAGAGGQGVALIGGPTPPGTGGLTIAGQGTGASLAIGYMAAGTSSWWGHASAVADRMALGRGSWGGRWIVWLAGLLLLASLVLVGGVLVRGVIAPAADADGGAPEREGAGGRAGRASRDKAEAAAVGDVGWRARLRGVPALAWAIAAVAVCNAAAWSFITPAFQVPDERRTSPTRRRSPRRAGRRSQARRSIGSRPSCSRRWPHALRQLQARTSERRRGRRCSSVSSTTTCTARSHAARDRHGRPGGARAAAVLRARGDPLPRSRAARRCSTGSR